MGLPGVPFLAGPARAAVAYLFPLPSEAIMPDADSPSIPQDPLVCNGAALRKATRRVSQLYDTVLAPCGLKVSQHSILVHIARAGSPSMTDLARAMVLDLSLIHI